MTYPQAAVKPNNGLATAALVIGIIAFIGAFVPVLNVGSIVLAVLALIFGLIGISRARRNGGFGAGSSITGLILAVATAITVPLVNIAMFSAMEDIPTPPSLTQETAPQETPQEGDVEEAGAEGTNAQQQALRHAQQYLDSMPFSKAGLIDQLEFEGYEPGDAKYGVEHITVDWNEQAALKAGQYLDMMAFSREGLIDQLVNAEGFTPEQAEHGVNEAGL